MSSLTEFPPGSVKAEKAGCTCPVIDNNHGWGAYSKGMFWINEECPVHTKDKEHMILHDVPYKVEKKYD